MGLFCELLEHVVFRRLSALQVGFRAVDGNLEVAGINLDKHLARRKATVVGDMQGGDVARDLGHDGDRVGLDIGVVRLLDVEMRDIDDASCNDENARDPDDPAGCKKPPIADWFHIAMRLQHAEQAASGLSTDTPVRMQAKAVIVPEVERLTGGSGTARSKTHGAHSSASARSRMSSRASAVTARWLCYRPGSCGTRCARSTTICVAKARGSSIVPDDTRLVNGATAATVRQRAVNLSKDYLHLDWEIEDLVGPEIYRVFEADHPHEIIRSKTVAGKTPRDLTWTGKVKLQQCVRDYAELKDLLEFIVLISALRNYLRLGTDHLLLPEVGR
jgi:hypothetical protein